MPEDITRNFEEFLVLGVNCSWVEPSVNVQLKNFLTRFNGSNVKSIFHSISLFPLRTLELPLDAHDDHASTRYKALLSSQRVLQIFSDSWSY